MKSKSSGRKSNSKGKNSSEGFVVIVGVVLVLLILCVLRKLLTKKESFSTNDIPSVTKYIDGIGGDGTNSDTDIKFNSITVIQIKNPIKYFLRDINGDDSLSESEKEEISEKLRTYIEKNMEETTNINVIENDFLNPKYLENLLEKTFVSEIDKYVNPDKEEYKDDKFDIDKLIDLDSVINSTGLFDIYKNKKLKDLVDNDGFLVDNDGLNTVLDELLVKLPTFNETDTEDKLKTYITNYVKNNVNDIDVNLNLFEKIILLEYADSLKIDSLTKSGDNYTMKKENIKEFIKKGIQSDFEITDQDTYEGAIELNYKDLLKCSSDSTNDLCKIMKTDLFPDVLNKPTTTQAAGSK